MLMTWHTRFSFSKTAQDLDDDHLRAQIDDAATLMDMIVDGDKSSEPAFFMWKDNLNALLIAGMLYCMEWTFQRRYDDRTFWKFSRLACDNPEFRYAHPAWFKDADLCRSHRSTLWAHRPESYNDELWPGTPERLPLLWPDPVGDPALAGLRVAKADLAAVRAKRLTVPPSIKQRVVNL